MAIVRYIGVNGDTQTMSVGLSVLTETLAALIRTECIIVEVTR